MSNQMTNAVALTTPPSQIDLALGSLTSISTTPQVFQPTSTYSSVLSAAGRITQPCTGWNYAKIMPICNTASITFTLTVIGWNRGALIGTTGSNVYNWVSQPLVQLSVTTGSTAVSGTPLGTLYGVSSFALSQGDSKIYNGTANSPNGFFVVDLLGCELFSITGTTVSGSATITAWTARV